MTGQRKGNDKKIARQENRKRMPGKLQDNQRNMTEEWQRNEGTLARPCQVNDRSKSEYYRIKTELMTVASDKAMTNNIRKLQDKDRTMLGL